MKNRRKATDRFSDLAKIYPEDACWPWSGCIGPYRYGITSYQGKTVRAHRLAWEHFHGPIPEGMCVLHRCDNPPCCNPKHLFIGTQTENIRDRDEKGRTARLQGEDNCHSKLTDEQVLEIRDDERAQVEIAKDYGITQQLVSSIKLRKHWTHI